MTATDVREFHFVLTLQRHGGTTGTYRGTINLGPGATRSGAFDHLRSEFCRDQGWSPDAVNVLFFSLELNSLDGAR